jgi:signal transduction histidine kinase
MDLAAFADAHGFLSQGQAYGWDSRLMWLNAVADVVIAAVAVVIPVLLLKAAQRRPDLRLQRVAIWLLAFGVLSGLALVTDLWNLWHTHYGLEAVLQTLATLAGAVTVWLAMRALPGLLALPSIDQLDRAREATLQAHRELESFTASVSHDLRSPLSSIAGQAGLLEIALADQVTDDQRRRLNRIQLSVKQMSELIDSLLMLSRVSRATLQVEPVNLTAMAQEIADQLQQQAPDRQVEFQIQPDMKISGDRKLLWTLLQNLMSNAWKFTSRTTPSRIQIGMSPGQDEITLHVRDNGLGFDMAYEEKLFKPFQKLHGNDLSGSGIGLALVKRIVERHGGRAWARGKVNEGSEFYCTLPLNPANTPS